MALKKGLKLGDMLVMSEKITEDELREALTIQKESSGKQLGEILIENKLVTEDQIMTMLEGQYNIKRYVIKDNLKKKVVQMLPKEVAMAYNAVVVDDDGSRVTVAMVNPFDDIAIDDIEIYTDREVEVEIIQRKYVNEIIAEYY